MLCMQTAGSLSHIMLASTIFAVHEVHSRWAQCEGVPHALQPSWTAHADRWAGALCATSWAIQSDGPADATGLLDGGRQMMSRARSRAEVGSSSCRCAYNLFRPASVPQSSAAYTANDSVVPEHFAPPGLFC